MFTSLPALSCIQVTGHLSSLAFKVSFSLGGLCRSSHFERVSFWGGLEGGPMDDGEPK